MYLWWRLVDPGQLLHVSLELPLRHVLLHPLKQGEHRVRAGQPLVCRRLGQVGTGHAEREGHPFERRDGVLVRGVVPRVDDPDPADMTLAGSQCGEDNKS